MAHYGEQSNFTITASGDFTAKQYHIVRMQAENVCVPASLNTDAAILGVIQNVPQNGEHGTVAYRGLSKVVAGAAITVGDYITSNGSARAITVTGSQQVIIGRAMSTAGADGNIISALLNFPLPRG